MTSAVESGFAMLAVAVFLGFIGFAVLLVKEQSSLLSSGTSSIQQQADLNYLFTSAKAHARWHLKQSSCSGYSSLASSIGNDQYGINFSKSDGTPVDVTISANMTNGMKPVQVYSNWTAYDAASMTHWYRRPCSASQNVATPRVPTTSASGCSNLSAQAMHVYRG